MRNATGKHTALSVALWRQARCATTNNPPPFLLLQLLL
jgi:hypothetical protein